jgi:tRNA dimethylallyltransferase
MLAELRSLVVTTETTSGPLVAIVGPTGVGKSALAMELAAEFPAEIISADSRQVYRYLDIGTDKPSIEQRTAVRHHLVDIVLPSERYTVVDFHRHATEAVHAIWSAKRIPFVVGGSGHYIRTLLEGLTYPVLEPDPDRQREAERFIETAGLQAAITEIARTDPATAARLDPDNSRRVQRALEIIKATGAPIGPADRNPLPAIVLGLDMDRKALYQKIDARVDRQIESGLAEETRSVLAMGFSPSLPVLSGLAYGQMMRHLTGELTLAQAAQQYKYVTHRLVRKHTTWFRKEPRVEWLDALNPDLVAEAGRRIREYLSRTGVR